MANGLFTGMLGFNPVDLQQKRMQQFLAPIQQAQNPYERIGAALGTIGGGALFGIEDPQLQRASKIRSIMDSSMQDVDITNPTAYKTSLLTLAENLKNAGETDAAMYAISEAAKLKTEKDKPITLTPGGSLVTPTGELIYQAPDREKDEAPLTIADRARLTQLQRQFGEEEGAVRFRKERDEVARKTAAAGREPGDLKITDVAAGKKIVEDIVGPDRKRLETVGLLKTQIADIRKGNPASVPQLQRGLVKVIGDSQIGQNEVNQALGASGFPQGVIEGINKFFTGLPTDLKIDQVEQAVEAIEDYYANRFNQGLGTASSLLSDTTLPKTTVEKVVGSFYTSAVEKRNKNLIASLKGEAKEAYNWAKSNPNDPRSAEIIKKLGVR